jgi:hypothetical protein
MLAHLGDRLDRQSGPPPEAGGLVATVVATPAAERASGQCQGVGLASIWSSPAWCCSRPCR